MFSKLLSCCYPPNKDNVIVKKEFTCEDNSDVNYNINVKSANMNNNIGEEDFATYIQNKKRENDEEQNGQFNGDKKFPVMGGHANINFNKSNSFKHLAHEQKYKLYYNSNNNQKKFFLDRLKMLNESKNDQSEFKRKVTTHNKEIQSMQGNIEEYLNTSVSEILIFTHILKIIQF